ncbi:hypothetical protein BDZ85DRAFT_293444 [Elsinoe ampelina]|uniref:Uncharacterized protein n=1 Tax=Elsinoe ampelina TaxID=302913 RepID=A0A6A6GL46_9PEZI|nr:hypothetical protein BDZ85DRAFT_293444 [Elsinoe ampelina]
MILSSPRKRSRDVEDDFDLTSQPLGKKSRASTATDSPLSISLNKTQWHFLQSPLQTHRSAYTSEDDSINSNASEAGSMTDDSMDLDLEDKARLWSPDPAAPLTPTTLPSWSSRGSISDDISMQNTPRKSEGMVVRPTRPKIYPLQSQSLRSDMTYRRHGYDYMAGSSMSITTDRLPSPVDDNEPHTPTTAAGSQLSLLSVNDMDVDSGSVTPVRQGSDNGSFMRRQRQRSGAFISPPEVAKKIQFGYRADCEKCRNKVPGHMNHFVNP